MNLFICTSPLQVLIAKKIISEHSYQNNIGIMITANLNDKNRYYFSQLQSYCSTSYLINLSEKNRIELFFLCFYYRYFFKLNQIRRVFFASIDSIYIQVIISSLQNIEIYTFDDGTANVFKSSLYYVDRKSWISRVKDVLLTNRFSMQKIKERSIVHFSIYENMSNIIDNVQYISLLNVDKAIKCLGNEKEAISIFLGQPISGNETLDKKYISAIIDEYGVDFYFPHPKERYHLDNVEYIQTDFIFEDYLINEIQQGKYCFKIFSFYSSALLNLIGIGDNVELIAIKLKSLDQYNELYETFSKVGIRVIEESS